MTREHGLGGRPMASEGPTYFTVQMSASAPGGRHRIHLGRYVERGALGAGLGSELCGFDRHYRGPDGEPMFGFSCGGGSTDPDARPCRGCAAVLLAEPGRVHGIFDYLFTDVDLMGLRPWTPDQKTPTGATRITVKRNCNGCGLCLGDANDTELEAAVLGRPLPDVQPECGCP